METFRSYGDPKVTARLSHSCLDIQKFLGLLASDPFPKFLGKKRSWPNLKGAHLETINSEQHWFNFNNHVDGWV